MLIELKNEYEKYKSLNLNLDMSRGKPNSDQLDICVDLFNNVDEYSNRIHKDGLDIGNYGIFSGIIEGKEFFNKILDIDINNIIVGGNSSLNLMYDMFSQLMMFGNCDSKKPWTSEEKIKFLCPVPGYDRHFAILETFGFEMINIPMLSTGPDMDLVEKLVKNDSTIKGIYCVPKYSNPDGITYSDETVKRLASMDVACDDFRIFWDNAYCVHHLYNGEEDNLLNILNECKKTNNENRVYIFASTSKISFPGAGISCIAASKDNIENIMTRMKIQTIGYDKLNMIRHSEIFPTSEALKKHMKNISDVLRPKFDIVLDNLEKELSNLDEVSWTKPNGGYFVSFFAPGCAKKIIKMCSDVGLKLTPAGSTYPKKNDPNDANIRIAPTYPSNKDLEKAVKIFVLCVKIAILEKE